MKPFNLEDALQGSPVKLRNGCKAYVLANIKDFFPSSKTKCPLIGISSNKDCDNFGWNETWTLTGSYSSNSNDLDFDIVSMWEDELTQEQILEKAYSQGLRITFDAAMFIDGYDVIGKTKDNEYIIEYGAVLRKIKPPIQGLAIYTPPPKQPMVTVTLPKPFKPEIGDDFYYIYSEPFIGTLNIKCAEFYKGRDSAKDGNLFRTFDDAKAWLDAMKEAVDE